MSSLILKRAKVIHDNSVNDNFLINGNFNVWQRGSSFYNTSYSADRWFFTSYNSNLAQRVNGNIGLPNSENCVRLSTLVDDSYFSLTQVVPTELTSRLRNKTATLSFYARPPSGTNNWSGPIYGEVFYSTNIDNIVDSRTVISDSIFSGTLTGNNDWKFYSQSFSVPSNASTLSVVIRPSGSLSINSKVDIAQVKLEVGSLATPLSSEYTNQVALSCKRFYQKVDANLKAGASASAGSQRQFGYSTTLPVQPRVSNATITLDENNSVALGTLSSSIINDSYLSVTANSNSPHSALAVKLSVDAELPVGRRPSKIDYMDINRTSGTINLDWNVPLYSEETTADYVVYYGTTPSNLNNIMTFIDSTGSLTGLSDFLPYYIKIKTINPFGESDLSNLFASEPLYTAPSAVLSPTGVWGNNICYISWGIPQNDGGSAITGYRIDRSMYNNFSAGAYTSSHYLPMFPTSFNIAKFSSELTSTGTYYFRISAMNLAGTGTPSVIAVPKTTPYAPTNLQTTVGVSQTVVLNYSPPTGNGGANITQAQLQHSTSSSFSSATTTSVTPNYQPITVSGLTNNTTYYFRMRYRNAVGYGSYSPTFSAVPFRTPTVPGAPSGLVASWVDNDTFSLVWLAPADNGGVPLTNYTIYSSTGSAFSTNLLNPINTTNSNASITADVPTTGSNSNFYFRAKANNSVGASSYSSSVTLAKQAPSAPILINAARGNANVLLSWSSPTSSRGSAITGYQINYSTSSNFASATTISLAPTNSYTISSLTNETTYYFRVRANNSVGSSAYSNTLSQTPILNNSAPSAPIPLPLSLSRSDAPYGTDIYVINGPIYLNPPNLSTLNYTALAIGIRAHITTPYSGGNIYGANPYSWDSDIRTAAIHAGALTPSQTGTIYLQVTAPLNNYSSVSRNGLTSTQKSGNGVLRSYQIAGSNRNTTPMTSIFGSGYHAIVMNWSPPVNYGGSSITGYEIQVSQTDSFVSPHILSTGYVPGNTTSFYQNISFTGNKYCVRMRASNIGGTSSWSNTLCQYNLTRPIEPSYTVSALSNTGIQVVYTGATSYVDKGYDNFSTIKYKLSIFPSVSNTSIGWYNLGPYIPLYTKTFTDTTFPASGTIAVNPGKYRCQMTTINYTYGSTSTNKFIEVPSQAVSKSPVGWTLTASYQCCSSSYTTAIVNGKTVYYPSVSALKDNNKNSTFSVYRYPSDQPYFIQADFGSVTQINKVFIGAHHLYSPTYYLNPHSLQASTDGVNWTTIGTIESLFNFTTTGETISTTLPANNGYRYIRILGSSSRSFIDLSEFYFT